MPLETSHPNFAVGYEESPDNYLAHLEEILDSADISVEQAELLSALLAEVKITDVIRLVERSNATRAALILRLLSRKRAIFVFDALDAGHQADLIDALGAQDVHDYFASLDPDDRVALLDEVPAEIAELLLKNLAGSERDVTGVILGYPKRSIGRRMSPKVPHLFGTMTVDSALRSLREIATEVETIYMLPIITIDRVVIGVTSLRDLFVAAGDELVENIMSKPITAKASADAEETARWFLALDLIAMPVVDESGRLVGILTVDDAHDIVESADSEDSARQGASEPLQQPYLSTPLLKVVRSRVVWLLVLALSALLTVTVLDSFEATIASAVVLSLFIPLLTGTGGNTGNQAATTVTRSLALGDLRVRDAARVAWREMRVGFILGLTLGTIGFFLAWAVYSLELGIVIATTLVLVCTISATVGGVMPIIAKKIGADPAVFSNPFISTFCDATGLIIYFLIAKEVLGL